MKVTELHPKEIELIRRIRTKYRFSTITVTTQDGLPHSIKQVINTELIKGVDTLD